MTGVELALLRKATGLSQSGLAQRAHIGRHAVSYWECKKKVDPNAWAIRRIAVVLELPDYRQSKCARASWGITVDEQEVECRLWEASRAAKAQRRVQCGATTRKSTHCRMKSVPGKRRCKFHGGLSTGAKTPEGRERIAEAQRRRWRHWRENKNAS